MQQMPGHYGEPEQPTPEQDAHIARMALRQGDLPHSVHHLAGALAADPTRAEWLALLEEWIARAGPDPLAFVPLGQRMFIGTMAIRAYIAAYMGGLDEGVDLLLQACRAQPQTPYAAWLERWRELPGFAQALAPARAASTVVDVVSQAPEYRADPEKDRAGLRNAAALLAVATATHPNAPFLWFFRSIALRKLGQYDEAVRVGQQGLRYCPGYHLEVALDGAYREQGRFAEAVEHFQLALRYDPDAGGIRNDIADNYLRMGRLDEAARWYGDEMQREPKDDWAPPSYQRTRLSAPAFRHAGESRSRLMTGFTQPGWNREV